LLAREEHVDQRARKARDRAAPEAAHRRGALGERWRMLPSRQGCPAHHPR
jgi:hypothetical protein